MPAQFQQFAFPGQLRRHRAIDGDREGDERQNDRDEDEGVLNSIQDSGSFDENFRGKYDGAMSLQAERRTADGQCGEQRAEQQRESDVEQFQQTRALWTQAVDSGKIRAGRHETR
jgi:hypothetical protein